MARPLLERSAFDESRSPTFSVFSAGYEGGRWRANELVRDFFRRHLSSFGLSYSAWSAIDGDSAAAALSRAARMIYSSTKYKRRGEFGELFLHGILRDFYGAEPAVSKIFFLDGPNETAKGFDCVHVTVNADGGLDLWVGEAKLYINPSSAVTEIISSLRDHFSPTFLRAEFLAVTNKLDENWPHAEQLGELLDENTSLDRIVDRIVVPVILAYQSPAISQHTSTTGEYTAAIIEEAEAAWKLLSGGLVLPKEVRVHFFALGVENTADLRTTADTMLRNYQNL